MRRFFILLTAASLTAVGAVGCQKQAETTRSETVSTPGGTTTTTDKHIVESTGKNPPANAQGESVK